MMDYFEEITVDLIKTLRGEKSQNQLSLALGYSDNRVNRWEKLKKPVYWNDLVKICEVQGFSLAASLKEVFGYEGDIDSQTFVSYISKSWTGKEIGERITKAHEKTINRWISGESEPKVSAMLELIELTKFRMIDFLFDLIKECEAESNLIAEKYHEQKERMSVFFGQSESTFIITCLSMADYHDHDYEDDFHYFAHKLSFDLEKVKEVCSLMEELGVISKNDQGKYVFNPINTVTTSRTTVDNDLLRTSINNRIEYTQDYLPHINKQEDLFVGKTYPSNKELDVEIDKIVRKCLRDISAVLKEADQDGPEYDRLRVLNLHYYNILRD